ncbi:bifunctional metallophosphatase/5'-nucleotidase [Flavonifractor sp. An92]|uniref:bifunctional metallophosphatase/5'-nucleotidase n=1 Tax=Flavonifractor sp. An92 TaxID=1965666 RepID=UPI000B39725E|nr:MULTISPECIES: bifunctional UDP-sugar hydrolase/5'-nucleotidase [unclassified Flavonifractor]OUN07352.1 bifunctional metallophosphatase/5'-nucleotidase [Flavonifractor sp. An92]OUQ23377.1 bifunctional metallophosphatase/5'-nucleotidase [Flavonifractor sp. An135]
MLRGWYRLGAVCLAGLLLWGTGASAAPAEEEPAPLTILFTHDTHDHFLPSADEEGGTYGGYVRLATLLDRERSAAEHPVVTLDGGDFSMGSLFQTIYDTDAPELRALGAMGYDVTTFGNHEYDYRAGGAARMLNAAVESGDPLPALVQANYKPPAEDTESWAAWENYGVTDYVVLEKEDPAGGEPVRVAVFGVLGVDADDCAPMSGMEFEPIADAAERVVDQIQAEEDADYIVCLSHSGTSNGTGEDYELAKAVDGIDVIISGHTHTTLEQPIQVNDTLIVSCGEYTQNLGVLTVSRGSDGAVQLEEYRLEPVDDTVSSNPDMTAMAEQFQTLVGERYLSDYGLTFDQVLAENPWTFPSIGELGSEQREETLGNLIADSYVYAVQQAEGADYEDVDFAVVAAGVIRASLPKGEVTTSDAFDISSLGSGADGTPGYPLVSVYIYGSELKDAFEVDASVTPLMSAAQLYGAGMEWTFNPNRLIFNKVTDCAQVLPDGSRVPIEDDQLYRVVTGLYSGQMLGTVNGKSFGILGITPRDKKGEPITDLEAYIIHNEDGTEVKEWYALASYLQSMGTVEERYSAPEGRKTVAPSWNPVDLLAHPNGFALIVYGVVLLLVAVVVLVVVLICRRRSRRSRGLKGRRRRGGGYSPYRG